MFCFYNGLVGGALISLAGYQIGNWQTAGGGASDADGAHSSSPPDKGNAKRNAQQRWASDADGP